MQPGSSDSDDLNERSRQNIGTEQNISHDSFGELNQNDEPNNYQPGEEADEIVQVVYQSNNAGSLVGVESSLISAPPAGFTTAYDPNQYVSNNNNYSTTQLVNNQLDQPMDGSAHVAADPTIQPHQPLTRAGSTLPSVAEESSSSAGPNRNTEDFLGVADTQCLEERTSRSISQANEDLVMDDRPSCTGGPVNELADSCCVPNCNADLFNLNATMGDDVCMNPHAIYSTVNKQHQQTATTGGGVLAPNYEENLPTGESIGATAPPTIYDSTNYGVDSSVRADYTTGASENRLPNYPPAGAAGALQEDQGDYGNRADQTEEEKKNIEQINAEICQIISRQKQGAAESGSLRNNFKKKLVVSASSNENYLTAHRKKLLDYQDANNLDGGNGGGCDGGDDDDDDYGDGDGEEGIGNLPSKFKRTHSVSFNVGSSRSSRHSVDIRNLPSYLTVKRASIVDVAKGAMSSLMHSFGGGGTTAGSSISKDSRRDSSAAIDEEPIFEEPIAPTLSLGQRVALVKNNGAEFGTVGWIGQLPDVDDDWVVGVIFDNMIGNCDGLHNGVRYFYSRENFAMFVPLSVLTKTDNYIGRPETGTMLSRMSVSLKPGQLISIQRSSIRLQHCFLNAPHQRVGHDVRAVSNRLHCQCHNCGPCAHLTKQHSRVNALPAFGAHHAVNKKNSLAHAAVEILAHHHHHYHEEEHNEEEDYQFGDNSAHACNFVRYSCCQQNGGAGHEFSSDCGLVRPELLDNLIHAPRAPHRRSARPRRMRRPAANEQAAVCGAPQLVAVLDSSAVSTLESSSKMAQIEQATNDVASGRSGSCSSCSSRSSSPPSRAPGDREGGAGGGEGHYSQTTDSYQMNSENYFQGSTIYNTLESRMSLYDQQRFIYKRESTTSVHSLRRRYAADDYEHDDNLDDGDSSVGLMTRVRRCFGCLKQRRGSQSTRDGRRKRSKKRKLSARNRLIEYRRKQSTFVPSTLAKPQDDFASHGVVLAGGWDPAHRQPLEGGAAGYNSDYSSYSKSSGSADSPNNSPRRTAHNQSISNYAPQQQFISIDHNVQVSGEQLKSPNAQVELQAGQLNYNDYTFDNDGCKSYEKFAHSQDSDLGYFDVMTNSSGGTLKDIVDQAIDREESLQQLAPIDIISPIQSADSVSHSCCDQIEVSSPTISMVDQLDGNELSERLDCLEITNKDPTIDNEGDNSP